MTRYRAVISYLGTNYVGWQRQLNGLSVQEVLENALSKLFGTQTAVVASGRTDAGVHAEGQTVHFDADTTIPPEKIPFAVNDLLPDGVVMLIAETAPDDFNARFSAKRKTYRYAFYVSRTRRPILDATHAHVVTPLDVAAMRASADKICGTHDFKCFEASGSVIKNTVRTVSSVEIKSFSFESGTAVSENGKVSEAVITVTVTGDGFLYNMVRIIAGTLVYVGQGKLTPDAVESIIADGDRTRAGKTMPAKGLCLVSVFYG